ncbi:hypothetical protein AMTRI_Chr04g252350 [Amborella trichopoda]|uniref:2-(3-amino-3-carboxypropyl)histidine synthase subunit 1 n=1 Tax=Amborella trichopoda TaxID=13333 RepID=W1NEX7_AMBTC|nr:2-(3-amino-3-carboxypropyl)histidine synthase subunit 1 [Amborella trichopoda]ERM94342.1 hypothetical protein AMTR_s00010p00243970 [Amborella trichopoda]|eukprot:XP_006827105.1 2-(3-amino-3-carboxypropyl)histidine synthase subunit 1 [Amborella trichopoda]
MAGALCGETLPSSSIVVEPQRRAPKRFTRQQIPDSILNDPSLKTAMALLPTNYNLEIPKSIWRIRQAGAKCVALQFPDGLLMYALIISDILETFAEVEECFILGDVTYGACCVDDFTATALGAELLIHYGHSCLVPIDISDIPCLYIFVDITIDSNHLVETIKHNFDPSVKIALAGTIQFSTAINAAQAALITDFPSVAVPQAKPLSAGEVLGCTSPKLPKGAADVVVFVADGRFHLEAFMIANPGVKAFRYDPYLKVMILEKYDHKSMREARKNAILQARGAKMWGLLLGTLGRQGNPRILMHFEKRLAEKGLECMVILMSELSPSKLALFGESIDAWVQIACPRLSIDWGEAFDKPLLTPFEAEVALGFVQPWWEKPQLSRGGSMDATCCQGSTPCCQNAEKGKNGMENGKDLKDNGLCASEMEEMDYPMDYYAQDGGEWNCSYAKRAPRERRVRTNPLSTG